MKKLLIITLFLGMTLPVFAQDEAQSATDEAVSRPFAESAVVERHSPGTLPRHRGRGRHRGSHSNRRGPVYTPPTPPAPVPVEPPGCVYTLTPAGARAVYSGDAGAVTVTTTAGCPYGAASNSAFIHVTGRSETTVSFSVDPNPTFFVRSGTMTIAGQVYSVTQDGAPLSFDGTYNISFSVIVTCPYIPPVSRSGSVSWTFVNGVLVNGNGVTTGTISSFGQVNITTTVAGYFLNFTGSFNENGSGFGLLHAGGVPYCGIGGSWQGARQ